MNPGNRYDPNSIKIILCELNDLKKRIKILEGGGVPPSEEIIPLTIPFTIA